MNQQKYKISRNSLDNQNLNLDLKFSKNSNSNEMEGKVCVVTGGTSGLGLEVPKDY